MPELENVIKNINKLVRTIPKVITGNLPTLSERDPQKGVNKTPDIPIREKWNPIENALRSNDSFKYINKYTVKAEWTDCLIAWRRTIDNTSILFNDSNALEK